MSQVRALPGRRLIMSKAKKQLEHIHDDRQNGSLTMSQDKKQLEPIEFSIALKAMPSRVFRALTSQNELRKWWAPRVVMARNIVSQRSSIDVQMKLVDSRKNHAVRYIWRPENWDVTYPQNTIAFTIHDLGISREDTGEGLHLEIVHDGWVVVDERQQQEKIWQQALKSLKSLIEKKKVSPWWLKQNNQSSLRQVSLQGVKEIARHLQEA